jgi:predicted peptidase
MTLFVRPPVQLSPDQSRKATLSFRSPSDGREQQVDVYSPKLATDQPRPLVLAPHPITWTAQQDYHGGLEGLKRGHHAGWRGLAEQYGVIVALPHGHHRRIELCSLASPEQIDDMVYLIDHLATEGYSVDRSRVYACGLSMGGQEALIAAGRHPGRFAAVFAFNPIVDLAAWQQDLASTSVEEIREFGTAQKIVDEVGGLPEQVPEAYAMRSAITYADRLAQEPTFLYWTAHDLVVPRQLERHSYRLYQAIKNRSITAPVAEYEHTASHGLSALDEETCWQLHEWCDYELALRWLLTHSRSACSG